MFKNFLRFKFNLILVPALVAGVIFLLSGFTFTVPKNVTVGGVAVGGTPIYEAARAVRKAIEDELKEKELVVRGEKKTYTFTFPEIYYKDNVFTLLKNAKKGDVLTPEVSYFLHGESDIASAICQSESVFAEEPSATFNSSGEPFTYHEGADGREADRAKLLQDIRASLCGGFEPVTVAYSPLNCKNALEEVKKHTCLLASFTTYFDGSNLCRASNIRLAAARLNGNIIESGKTLSFNDIVGAREASRGFLPAKIIENGEYTEGIGGGVCQVSTTLYNCALLSGLEIAEFHPHSLAVGYVPPSRDAMVSGTSCDLKIKNIGDYPAYIRASTGNGSVTFRIYGTKSGAEYSIISEVTGSIAAPEEICDDPEKVREGKDGLTSESYLVITRGGYKKTVRLRRDKYLPVKSLVYEQPQEEPQEGETI